MMKAARSARAQKCNVNAEEWGVVSHGVSHALVRYKAARPSVSKILMVHIEVPKIM